VRQINKQNIYSSQGLRGNSSKNALRSVTQSITGCIPKLERGNDENGIRGVIDNG